MRLASICTNVVLKLILCRIFPFTVPTVNLPVYNLKSYLSQSNDAVGVGIRKPYLRVVGITVDTDGSGRSTGGAPITSEEEDEFRRLAKRTDVFDVVARSIAPSIYGSEDIKKCIACLLFGGSRKRWDELN